MRAHFCSASLLVAVSGSLMILQLLVTTGRAARGSAGWQDGQVKPQPQAQQQQLPQQQQQPQQKQQQQQQSQQQPQQQQQRPLPQTGNLLQLGGKCARLASCRERGRRRAMDAGPDQRACYCDQRCSIYDDCCADAPAALSPQQRAQLGAAELRRRRQHWHCHPVNPIFGDVLLRASCSPAWLASQRHRETARQVQRRCEYVKDRGKAAAQARQADPVGMMMPITDLTSGVTFANSYCLRCNPEAGNGNGTEGRRLVYWSPLLECTYNLDSDDRNTLWDLVSSRRGQALRYSAELNRWLVAGAGDGPDRACSITPTMPDSVEHIVRYCRARTTDTCPPPEGPPATPPDGPQREARLQCELGHQALVYGQTSGAVYRNLACATCHRERQVFCEPRLRKNLAPVSRVIVGPQSGNGSERVVWAPPTEDTSTEEEAGVFSASGAPEEGVGSRSGGQAGAAISGSFSVLMDLYGGSQDDEQVGAVHQCAFASGQVYDPFFLTCRDVVCGLNHRFVNGRCAELLANETRPALAAPDQRLGSLGPSSSESSSAVGRQQVVSASRQTEPPDSEVSTGRSSAHEASSARLVGSGAGSTGEPQILVNDLGDGSGEEAAPVKNELAWQAAVRAALSQLHQAPSSDSRRAFAECGKILIQAEHYRLFSLDSTLTRANLSSGGQVEDNRLLQQLQRQPSNKLWAFVAPYNLTLSSSQFELIRSAPSSPMKQHQFNLLICSPFSSDLVAKFKPAMVYITTACLAVSIASLALYLALYCLSMFDLRHLTVDMVVQQAEASKQSQTSKHQPGEHQANKHLDNKHRPSRASSETQSSLGTCSSSRASQSLSSRGVACLAGSLLAAYLLFIAGNQREPQALSCYVIALATYYCFLVAFNWMFLLAYDIWRTLRLATCQLRGPAQHAQSKRFLTYSLFALLSSALVVGLAIGADLAPLSCEQPAPERPASPANSCGQADTLSQLVHTYRPKFGQRAGACWFANRRALALFFGLPVTLIMLVNLLFFLHSSFMVIRTSSRSSRHRHSPSSKQRDARTRQWTRDNASPLAKQQSVDSSLASLQTLESHLSACSSGEDSPPPEGAREAPAKRPLESGLSSSSLTNQSIGTASVASSLATRYDAHLASLSSVMGSLVKDYRLYCRLSTIMGLTWLTGLMASVVDQSEVLWYLFVVLNTLQGLFIFIAFGCKRSKLANLKILLAYLSFRWRRPTPA